MLKKGDKVVMHTCLAASIPAYQGKVWTCKSEESIAENGKPVVLLEGFQGPFTTEYLQKVNMPNVREPVLWFAEQMELKLQENDHKGGWENCGIFWLRGRLLEEANELSGVMYAGHNSESGLDLENIIREASDVANFAMMIADQARKRLA
ncbi:hypothetical protein BRE01_31110 [Brevibacillus reuszeri]|uniref:Uncharacterized protein n=1 Tax=Brevibacillus reuszeri TaxID=54915 RepID=A0A0K9YYL8_9BACL|nr:hypothetical protein [Brevibacillus reuszeri]KNB73751.1 hypothetical protein ADS79_07385 [Brevibacillus reuszeri]MED1858434.1 hypothetical protein [Brevibacillus reuszeri]GED69409.1 hypothetical protein BRE01_31110 [Brevibacillus reuszeri]